MRILYDENGNKVEVPDEKELEGLRLAADKNKERKKLVAELEEKIKDYEADDGKRNFRALRKKAEALERALKKLGKKLNSKGEIIDVEEKFDPGKLLEEAKKAARSELLQNHINSALSKIEEEEQRKVVRHYFDKLTAGEELTLENVDSFMEKAVRLAQPVESGEDNLVKDILNADSAGAVPTGSGSSFADTERGKALAKELGMVLEVPQDNGGEDQKQ